MAPNIDKKFKETIQFYTNILNQWIQCLGIVSTYGITFHTDGIKFCLNLSKFCRNNANIVDTVSYMDKPIVYLLDQPGCPIHKKISKNEYDYLIFDDDTLQFIIKQLQLFFPNTQIQDVHIDNHSVLHYPMATATIIISYEDFHQFCDKTIINK